jgi:hypothetical protein
MNDDVTLSPLDGDADTGCTVCLGKGRQRVTTAVGMRTLPCPTCRPIAFRDAVEQLMAPPAETAPEPEPDAYLAGITARLEDVPPVSDGAASLEAMFHEVMTEPEDPETVAIVAQEVAEAPGYKDVTVPVEGHLSSSPDVIVEDVKLVRELGGCVGRVRWRLAGQETSHVLAHRLRHAGGPREAADAIDVDLIELRAEMAAMHRRETVLVAAAKWLRRG